MSDVSVKALIRNRQGLHARPSALVVKTAARHKTCTITLAIGGETANAKSIMEVMMLASPAGTEVTILASGEGADVAAAEVAQVIDGGFGEELDPAWAPGGA